MAGLQRSVTSFRRQGSSGMIWEDKHLTGQVKKEDAINLRELRPSQSVGSIGMLQRNKSISNNGFRTGKVSPALDPPSPKVSGCGFCGFFGEKSSRFKSVNSNEFVEEKERKNVAEFPYVNMELCVVKNPVSKGGFGEGSV
ncbi:hypothetical protein GIB67_025398 [Kingdonia uniflora]|uniref:MAPK kinase substrate protein n=1 Tax=Kingdonia uniflora TaxID=39325 RepID=A0A7J7NC72_9MAGN|nr:hypothetical protein GIB67_025398 [Kingdonia uniflora]